VFVLQFALLVLALRAPGAWTLGRVAELAALISLGVLCARLDVGRRSRAGAALLAASYVVVQLRFYRYYHTPIDARVLESLVYSFRDVLPVAARAAPPCAAATIVASLFEYVLLTLSQGAAALRPAIVGLAAATLSLSVAAPAWGVTRRYLDREAHVVRATAVPELPSTRTELPSILFLLTESVRASDYCSAHGPGCATSPEVDRLLPERAPLLGMRAVASYTAVSVSTLFTGRAPFGSLEALSSAPGLFDFTRAVRSRGAAPTMAYWSAQTASVFSRRDVRSAADSFVAVDDLVGHDVADEDEVIDAGLDRLLLSYAERHLHELREPFTLVLHFQGTHAPYFTNTSRAPFTPMSHTVAWSGLDALHNAYKNSIVEQDHDVAAAVRLFLEKVGERPYVVFFTSDHGEAFGEHGAIHHGQNLYDEQIHVPAWVAWGNGALDASQVENLKSYREALVTHLDVLPTLLDVMGVLDGFAFSRLRKELPGRSLVAPRLPLGHVVPLTNCTALFPCPLETWGVLDETHEFVGQPWDGDFRCVALGSGAQGESGECAALREASRRWFPRKPNGAANL
jgi:hypothetical protein